MVLVVSLTVVSPGLETHLKSVSVYSDADPHLGLQDIAVYYQYSNK